MYHGASLSDVAAALSDDFQMSEAGHARVFSKEDFLKVHGAVLAAVPDFSFAAATSGVRARAYWGGGC
jgi:hypothetical protein